MALQRKKSLPDVQVPLNAPASITREEVSVLSSARREEMRRVEEENERLRANPLLYLVSPHMKVRATAIYNTIMHHSRESWRRSCRRVPVIKFTSTTVGLT